MIQEADLGSQIWRALTIASTAYVVALSVFVVGRHLCVGREPMVVLHVICLALSWMLACTYFVVDMIDRWYVPVYGVRVSLALMSNLWAGFGLHILLGRLRRQKSNCKPC